VYSPFAGFGGSLEIWAAHPLVVDQLNQAGITVYRMYANPSTGDIRMSKNSSLNFSINLLNPGDVPLTGITTTFTAYQLSGNTQIPVATVTATNLSGSSLLLTPNQTLSINLQLNAAINAPDSLQVLFTFTSAEGASATFAGVVDLLPAVPVLSVTKPAAGYLEVSLNRGDQLSGQITVANVGLNTLQGVTLTPPTNSWMMVNVPVSGDGLIHLPDMGVGQSNSFAVVFIPPTNTPIGYYSDAVTIQGTNQATPFVVNVYALVTSSQMGGVQFSVDDILGEWVTNATVRLHNKTISADAGPFYTDTNGMASATNLEEGVWDWQVIAPGCSANSGTVNIVPDQVGAQAVRLNRSLVTINFTVVPVPFTDDYQITVSQTYETFVPLPVLVVSPSYQEFHNVSPGFSATFNATVENQGLVQMTDLNIHGARNGTTVITPLITYLPVLLPLQTVEIPFTVNYLGANAPTRQDGSGGCSPPDSTLGDAFESDLNDAFDGMGVCPKDATPVQVNAAVNTALWEFGSGADGNLSGAELSFVQCVVSADTGGGGGGSFGGGGGADGGGGGGGGGGGQSSDPWAEFPSDGCFAPETPVLLADGSRKPIAELQAGQWVRSGERTNNVAKIEHVYSVDSVMVCRLRLADAGAHPLPDLQATVEHLVWVDGLGWREVGRLKPGDWLLNSQGQRVLVTANQLLKQSMKVFTLKLAGDTAFYADDVLVHDLCGPVPTLGTQPVKTTEVAK